MYPSRFHYEAPASLDEALQLLRSRRKAGEIVF